MSNFTKLVIIFLLVKSITAQAFIKKPSTYQLQQAKNSIVQIVCDKGTGTGTIIAKNKVLTAFHVIDGSANCIVLDHKNNDYGIVKVYAAEQIDLALLVLDKSTKQKGLRVSRKELDEYSPVFTIGFPMNMSYIVSEGRYDGKVDKRYNNLTLDIIFGNSGGGLLAIEDGEIKLFGVINAVKQLQLKNDIVPIYHLSFSISNLAVNEFLKVVK